MDKKRGTSGRRERVSSSSVKNFLSHSAEKFRRGNLLCFRKFLVSKKFMDKRGVGPAGGGREYQVFPSKFFCLTVLKIFIREPFSASLISGIQKFYAYERNITVFYKKFVVSQ